MSATLQFKIECYIAGVVEGGRLELYTVEEKRNLLRDWAISWKTLHVSEPQSISIGPQPWQAYRSGATFANVSEDRHTILFTQIGSRARKIPSREPVSHEFNFRTTFMHFEPAVDLLVLAETE